MADPITHPPSAATLLAQGLYHHRQGQIDQAMERYTEVLRNDPENADALYYVAVVACQDGQFQQGAELARRALSFGKPQARVHNLLGQALYRLGDRLEAIKNYDQAIALDANLADAHGNRANVLVDAGMPAEALKSFDRALALNPKSAADWLNRGTLLNELGRHQDALESYDKAIACNPNFAEAHVNRGNTLKEMAQLDEARGLPNSEKYDEAAKAYTQAIKVDRQFEEAYLGRALLNLLRGDWPAGFADYDHRAGAGVSTHIDLPDPRWDGEKRDGERVVLVTEQGLGDTIQFCRFAPVLAARGFDVTILTRKAMAPLLSTLHGVTIETEAEQLKQDKRPLRWLPLLSVPGVLGTTPGTVPAEVPYLAASPALIERWSRHLDEKLGTSGFKIGICWSPGHFMKTSFANRDIPLAAFAPLAALPGVQLVSLQKGDAVGQIARVPFGNRIMTLDADPDPEADFFLDTAAVMTQLDLIVTCDTSVTHLAGALARPVFTVVPMVSDWRWLLRRDDTPWYPTMRLFRQDASRQWGPVFERMAAQLREKLAAGAAVLPLQH